MKFYAFDSFKGLPPITGIDKQGTFKEGQYACSLRDFKKNLVRGGVDIKKVNIIPGWYKNSLNDETKRKIDIKSAAIIMIDCDLYKSTILVLDFIKEYIIEGTLLIFDDWFSYRGDENLGEQKAFNDWLRNNSIFVATEYQKFGWHGNSFILHRKLTQEQKI